MRTEPIQFISSAYRDQVRSWSSQDICNWIPSAAEVPGTTTQQRAVTAPGLKPHAEFGTGTVRGIYNCNDILFAVVGTQLYQLTNNAVAIPRGVIPGVQRVKFAHNQITGGNELVIVNGSSGYLYNTVTQTLSKIVSPSFPGSIDVVFIDNYFVHIEPQRRFAFSSGLANGATYSDLDRFTSEVKPDLLVGMIETNNELLLFSETSAEFFENSGAANQPFRSKRIYMNRGCGGRDTVNLTDNTVFWLGDDGCFYRLDSYSPIRISTRPIEEAIRGLNWAQAFSFVWNDSGHSVVYWTFPDGLTFGYDAATRMWHRRSSNGLTRWRANCMATWSDRWFAGDFQRGRVWEVDWDYHLEGDQEIEREMTAPVVRDNQNRVIMPRFEAIMDVGNEPTTTIGFAAQPNGPTASGDAPNASNEQAYSYSYTVTIGSAPISRVSVSGALPPGLTITRAGVLSGTPLIPSLSAGEHKQFDFVITFIDSNGLYATVADSMLVVDSAIPCGSASEYQGGQSFPTTTFVTLGSGTGLVTIKYATAGNPDKFEVWINGVKVADTGYHGDTSFQAALNADLASRGLPPETITQRPGNDFYYWEQWDNGNYETLTFSKSTSFPVAEVRTYGPLAGTGWMFSLDCPT